MPRPKQARQTQHGMGNPGVFCTLGSEILLQEWYEGQPWQNGFQNIILLKLEEDSHRHNWTKKSTPGTDF